MQRNVGVKTTKGLMVKGTHHRVYHNLAFNSVKGENDFDGGGRSAPSTRVASTAHMLLSQVQQTLLLSAVSPAAILKIPNCTSPATKTLSSETMPVVTCRGVLTKDSARVQLHTPPWVESQLTISSAGVLKIRMVCTLTNIQSAASLEIRSIAAERLFQRALSSRGY